MARALRPALLCLPATLLLGCPAPPEPTVPDAPATTAAPESGPAEPADPPAPAVEADDPAQVEKLRELGATVKTDADGKVVAVDTLKAAGFGDEQLPLLVGLDRLENLSLENSVVTDEGLAVLREPSFANVTRLNLGRCAKIGDAALAHAATLPKLERLTLLYNKDGITNESMANLEPAQTLRVLDIRGCLQVKDEGLASVSKLKNLVDFKHRGFNVRNDGLASLATLPKLRVLMMQDAANVDSGGVRALAPLDSLTNLDLTGTSVEDDGLEGLAGKKIKDLRLRNTLVEGYGVAGLEAAHDSLRYLDLNESFADDDSVKQLGVFKNLETLLVWQTDVTDEGLSVLAELPKLKRLMLKALPDVTDAGMDAVAGVATLETLDLSESGVTDEGIAKLHGLSNLKKLEVSNTAVTPEGVTAIREAIPGLDVTN